MEGEFEGKFYSFRVNDGEWLHESPDIYARCVGVNGIRGMICDPLKSNPENWEGDTLPRYKNSTDVIIYETHIRDFTVSDHSGIVNKGKYLGFCEENTVSPEGQKNRAWTFNRARCNPCTFIAFF